MDAKALVPAAERRGVSVWALPPRTVLNRSGARRVPMDLTINPYRGCEFGCRYCYARYTHQWLDHPDPLAFEQQLYAKLGAEEVFAGDLARIDVSGRSIAIGTATDPYQPIERELEITRGILRALCGTRGARIRLQTKSDLVTRDLDLLGTLAERHELRVGVTLVTLDRCELRRLEPRAPTPARRLAAIAELAAAGLDVGIFYAPLLPGINDTTETIDEVLAAAAAAGARFAWPAALWVPAAARPVFFAWLQSAYPALVPRYRRLYRADKDAPSEVTGELYRRFARVQEQYPTLAPRPEPRQMALFELEEVRPERC